jgi:hypothetical protein
VTLTISPQVRLVAVLGGVAALALGAFMLTMGRGSGSTQASVGTIKPLHPVRALGTHGTVHTRAKTAPKTTAKPKPVAAKPKPKRVAPKPAKKPIALVAGLPSDLADALRKHEVAVVAVVDPQAAVDKISEGEASAAAAVTGVGFVSLNVLDQRQAAPLVRQLGILPDPAVLLYRRPGELVARFDGFADRDTVAQAVINALPPELAQRAEKRAAAPVRRAPPEVTLATWAAGANKACARFSAGTQKIQPGAPVKEFLAWAPAILAAQQELIAKLTALALPTGPHNRLLAKRLLATARRAHTSDKQLYLAVKRGDMAAAQRIATTGYDVGANDAARAAGATGCAFWGT